MNLNTSQLLYLIRLLDKELIELRLRQDHYDKYSGRYAEHSARDVLLEIRSAEVLRQTLIFQMENK